jgi:hypothetical protein
MEKEIKEEKTYSEHYVFLHRDYYKRMKEIQEIGFTMKEQFNFAVWSALCQKPVEEVVKDILDYRIKQKDKLKEIP